MAAAAEVNVKVVFPALDGQTKVMRFDVDASIQNVIKEIKEKVETPFGVLRRTRRCTPEMRQ